MLHYYLYRIISSKIYNIAFFEEKNTQKEHTDSVIVGYRYRTSLLFYP
jgi:hypothetical protein